MMSSGRKWFEGGLCGVCGVVLMIMSRVLLFFFNVAVPWT